MTLKHGAATKHGVATGIDAEEELYAEVGLVLTPPGSGIIKKAKAAEVLAIVCPNCHVIFFDDFAYKTLETLKN